jgi:hypothetical protein
MNCHQKSEAHLWRYSKTNKTRRCLKCKSLIPLTKEEVGHAQHTSRIDFFFFILIQSISNFISDGANELLAGQIFMPNNVMEPN